MTYTPNASQEYLKNAVLTATPEQLQLMLYDGAIRFATRGLEAVQANDREGAFNALDRAQRIVLELNQGIRREVNPELADQMAALYNFVYNRLIEGNINQDQAALEDALRILRHLRETWVMLMDKLAQEQSTPKAVAPQDIVPPRPTPVVTPAEEEGSGFSAEG